MAPGLKEERGTGLIPGLITFVIQPSAIKIWMGQTSCNSLTGSLAHSLTHSACVHWALGTAGMIDRAPLTERVQ